MLSFLYNIGNDYWNQAFSFSPDGNTVAIVIENRATSIGRIVIFDLRTRAVLGTLVLPNSWSAVGLSIMAFKHSPDGRYLAAILQLFDSCYIAIFSLETGQLAVPLIKEDKYWSKALAYSPDGRTIVTAGNSGGGTSPYGFLTIWDTQTGVKLGNLNGTVGLARDCRYSADGQYILSAGGSNNGDGEIATWSVATLQKLRSVVVPRAAIYACDYSPDNRYALAASGIDNKLYIYDNQLSTQFHVFSVAAGRLENNGNCRYSPDGNQIIWGGQRSLAILNATTGQEITRITKPITQSPYPLLRAGGVSPDGRYVFTSFMYNY